MLDTTKIRTGQRRPENNHEAAQALRDAHMRLVALFDPTQTDAAGRSDDFYAAEIDSYLATLNAVAAFRGKKKPF